jgi:hypothetical protein
MGRKTPGTPNTSGRLSGVTMMNIAQIFPFCVRRQLAAVECS